MYSWSLSILVGDPRWRERGEGVEEEERGKRTNDIVYSDTEKD
jgi:hypothetical protein